jgi:hypothetical protein
MDMVRQYGIVDFANLEMISYAFFDKLTYTSAATLSLNFFQVQKSDTTGNMPLAGQLPSGFFFIIQAIRLAIFPASTLGAATAPGAAGAQAGALNDVLNLLTTGDSALTVGAKEYGRWPIHMLPGGGGPFGYVSNIGTETAPAFQLAQFGMNGPPDPRAVYSLPVPLLIPPQYPFKLFLTWAAALTLAAGNTPITAILDGTLIRPKQ